MESRVVFIMGSMRSGTTALVRGVMAHRDVILADPVTLGLSRDPATWESGIFVTHDDDGVMAAFSGIDGRAPVILEKTPSHIFHLERARALFPDARFILTLRRAEPVLKSAKRAYATFIEGEFSARRVTRHWARASRIALDNIGRDDCLVVPYDTILADPRGTISSVLEHAGLSLDEVQTCITAMNDKEGVRVQGVEGASLGRGEAAQLSPADRMWCKLLSARMDRRVKNAISKLESG